MCNELQANAQALVAAQTVGLVPPAPTTAADDFYRYDGPQSIKDLTTPNAVSFTIKAPPMRLKLGMYSESGKYGTLWFDENGCFQFEGDASASAQVLFDEMKRLAGK